MNCSLCVFLCVGLPAAFSAVVSHKSGVQHDTVSTHATHQLPAHKEESKRFASTDLFRNLRSSVKRKASPVVPNGRTHNNRLAATDSEDPKQKHNQRSADPVEFVSPKVILTSRRVTGSAHDESGQTPTQGAIHSEKVALTRKILTEMDDIDNLMRKPLVGETRYERIVAQLLLRRDKRYRYDHTSIKAEKKSARRDQAHHLPSLLPQLTKKTTKGNPTIMKKTGHSGTNKAEVKKQPRSGRTKRSARSEKCVPKEHRKNSEQWLKSRKNEELLAVLDCLAELRKQKQKQCPYCVTQGIATTTTTTTSASRPGFWGQKASDVKANQLMILG